MATRLFSALFLLALVACAQPTEETIVNTAPTAQIIAPATAYVGDELTVEVESYDADGDSLTETLTIDGSLHNSPARVVPE